MTTPPELARYLESFRDTWEDHADPASVRFVVMDCETTGLDSRKDRLVSIGAVSLVGSEIVLDDSFEALLKIDYNLSAVTVHGITRDQARDGMDEDHALLSFLDYLGDGVIVGHHIGHDIATMNVALDRYFGEQLHNRWLDTMDLTLLLQRSGAFDGLGPLKAFSLDAVCDFFNVTPHDRHTATGDALLTALVFLKLLRVGRRFGRGDLVSLCERVPPDEPQE